MHAEININGSTIMFADCTDTYQQQNAGMFVYVDNCDQTYQKALDNGAENIIPPANQSYGRSAGVKDPFGNTWWITNPL
jgi:PhnB protein